MQPSNIVEYVLKHADRLHPEYTKTQKLMWAMGFLATIVTEKNLMDNIVWARIDARVRQLYEDKGLER